MESEAESVTCKDRSAIQPVVGIGIGIRKVIINAVLSGIRISSNSKSEVSAAGKCVSANIGDAIRDFDSGQVGTARKCIDPNVNDAVGYFDRAQVGTISKCPDTNCGDAVGNSNRR